jgi:hypothetical protein
MDFADEPWWSDALVAFEDLDDDGTVDVAFAQDAKVHFEGFPAGRRVFFGGVAFVEGDDFGGVHGDATEGGGGGGVVAVCAEDAEEEGVAPASGQGGELEVFSLWLIG